MYVQLVCPHFPNIVSNNPKSLDCTNNGVLGICQTSSEGKH